MLASYSVRNCVIFRAIALPRGRIDMVNPQLVMYEAEFNQIQRVCDRLVREANARTIFIVDKTDTVRHAEYVKEIASHPNYGAALEAAKKAVK